VSIYIAAGRLGAPSEDGRLGAPSHFLHGFSVHSVQCEAMRKRPKSEYIYIAVLGPVVMLLAPTWPSVVPLAPFGPLLGASAILGYLRLPWVPSRFDC